MSVRVLIVDDQGLVRTGFRKILESEPDLDVVGEAADGEQAVERARALRPDVVLMDIRMPRVDGLEATRRLTGRTRVLILTTFDVDEYVYEALRSGASGFLLKDAPAEQRRDRGRAGHRRRHGQDARRTRPAEARPARSRAGGRRRLRDGARPARRRLSRRGRVTQRRSTRARRPRRSMSARPGR